MSRVLVVANETVVGTPLIEAVKQRSSKGDLQVHVICPQNTPSAGWTSYADEGRAAAENRLKSTLELLDEAGVKATGELMDPDPFTAIMDAVAGAEYDEIIISTHPETKSGWLRRDLVERVKRATNRPVQHVVVGHDDKMQDILVVANQTVEDEHLFQVIKDKADQHHRFVVILPQGEGGAGDPYDRLAGVLKHLEEAGIDAVGQVVHPDPYTAIQNAVRFYPVDQIIISTFEPGKSGWLREDLVERVKSSTGKPVEHVVSSGGGS